MFTNSVKCKHFITVNKISQILCCIDERSKLMFKARHMCMYVCVYVCDYSHDDQRITFWTWLLPSTTKLQNTNPSHQSLQQAPNEPPCCPRILKYDLFCLNIKCLSRLWCLWKLVIYPVFKSYGTFDQWILNEGDSYRLWALKFYTLSIFSCLLLVF